MRFYGKRGAFFLIAPWLTFIWVMAGQAIGDRTFELTKLSNGLYDLDIKKGEEAILWTGKKMPDLSITALP